jgi:hypothetical protein
MRVTQRYLLDKSRADRARRLAAAFGVADRVAEHRVSEVTSSTEQHVSTRGAPLAALPVGALQAGGHRFDLGTLH